MLVLGIDIGSLFIKVALCEVIDKDIKVVYTTKEINKGSKCGIIHDLVKTKKTLKTIIDRVSNILIDEISEDKNDSTKENEENSKPREIDHYIVNISGSSINSYTGTSTIPLWKKEGEDRRVKVTKKNINEVIDSAKMTYSNENKKVIHTIAQEYKVDDNEYTLNPVSMTGVKLKGNVLVIQSEKNQLENLDNILNECDIKEYDLVFSPIASAEAIIDEEDKDSGVIVVIMGGETTELVVYENSTLRLAKVIPLGSDFITRDIRYVLKVDYKASEALKRTKGDAFFEDGVSKDEKINLNKFSNLRNESIDDEHELFADNNNGDDENNVDLSHLSKIISSRTEEIFDKVLEDIYEGDFQRKVHTAIVLEGEAMKLKGADKLFNNMTNSSIVRRRITGIDSSSLNKESSRYITAIGLVKYGVNKNYFIVKKENEFDDEEIDNGEGRSMFSRFKTFLSDLV